jgi:transcriptional regulator with XRE-family HTH domain
MKNAQLAKRIKELRTQNGFSQEELAERSGLSLRTIQRIENGETIPREDSLKRLSAILGESTDTLGWTMKENRGLLMMINFSALSYILFPFLGVLIPLFVWLSNKRTIKDLDKTGRKILNFQITWLILLMLWFIVLVFGFVSMFKIGNFDGGAMGHKILIQEIGLLILYPYNFILVIINAFRIDKGKELFYFPSIPFFRIKK